MANYRFIGSVLIFFGTFFSYNPSEAQLLIGPKIGGQLSWENHEEKDRLKELYDFSPLIGYSGGFTVAFKVEKRFFLQTDFIYSRKGKRIIGEKDELLKFKIVNHHLDVPIIYRMDFKAHLGQSIAFKWYVGVGPNISYWWKGNGTLESSELLENELEKKNFKVKFGDRSEEVEPDELLVTEANRIQLGINFGTGLIFEPQGMGMITVDLKFELGHSYLSKDRAAFFNDLSDFANPLRTRNMGLRLGVSYLFDTKIAERKKGKSSIKLK